MTNGTDPRRQATTASDQELEADEAAPERDLHPVLGAHAAAIGGIAAGFPVGAIANPDLPGDDDPAEGRHETPVDGDGDPDTGHAPVQGEGTTQRR